MLSQRISGVRYHRNLLMSNINSAFIVLSHSKTCPTQSKGASPSTCPGSSGGGGSVKLPDFKRAERSAPCRYGFLPENWFVFFYPHTGVSGPYVFGLVLINYWLSKEIYVMEHEYYLGLSVALMTYFATTRLGPGIAKSLDEGVDAYVADMEKGRKIEKDYVLNAIKAAEDAQMRANGQKLLMDAKKENIAMQLEAAYRERLMMVFRATKGRLDYQAKKHWAISRIHQKWMIDWILDRVRKAITPDFEQQALDAAIRDLSAAAGRT